MAIESDSLRYMLSLIETTREDAINGYIATIEKNSVGREIDLSEKPPLVTGGNWKVRIIRDNATKQLFAIKTKKYVIDDMDIKPFQFGGSRMSHDAYSQFEDLKRHVAMESYIFHVLGKHHPHIARVVNTTIDINKHELCLKMDHYSGTVADLIQKIGPLAPHTLKKFMRHALLALAHCHANLVIHCDVKPENILVDIQDYPSTTPDFFIGKEGVVGHGGVVGKSVVFRLSDFDMGKLLLPAPHPEFVVGPDYAVNSVGFKPPEIVCGANYGYPVDIWGLGVSVIHMHCDTRMSVLLKVGKDAELQRELEMQSVYCGAIDPEELTGGVNPYGLIACDLSEALGSGVERCFGKVGRDLVWLLNGIFVANPERRITAKAALMDPYFYM